MVCFLIFAARANHWHYNTHCRKKGAAVKCKDKGVNGHLECASEDGVDCAWSKYDAATVNEQLDAPMVGSVVSKACTALLNGDGTDSCQALGCTEVSYAYEPHVKQDGTLDWCEVWLDPHYRRFGPDKAVFNRQGLGEEKVVDAPRDQVAIRSFNCNGGSSGATMMHGLALTLGVHHVEHDSTSLRVDGTAVGWGTSVFDDLTVVATESTSFTDAWGTNLASKTWQLSGGFGEHANAAITVMQNDWGQNTIGGSALGLVIRLDTANAAVSTGVCSIQPGEVSGCNWGGAPFSQSATDHLQELCQVNACSSYPGEISTSQICQQTGHSYEEAVALCTVLSASMIDACQLDFCATGYRGVAAAEEAAEDLDPGSWFYNSHCADGGFAVKCSQKGSHLLCASQDGATCSSNTYHGAANAQIPEGLVVETRVVEMACPGFVNDDGTDPCEALGCYNIQPTTTPTPTPTPTPLSTSSPPQTCAVFECPLGSTMKADMEDHACTGLACARECCTEGPYNIGPSPPPEPQSAPPPRCRKSTKLCMSSEQPAKISSPESHVFIVPCEEGNPKQRWFRKGSSLISKASQECIAVKAKSSYSALCYSLSLVKCNSSDSDQQWVSGLFNNSASSKDCNVHNAHYNIELFIPGNVNSSSQMYACARSHNSSSNTFTTKKLSREAN